MRFTEYELGELGEIITGKTPKKSNSIYYDSDEVIFIKPDDMTVNNIKYISTANEFVSSQGAATGKIVGKGTVLVTCIGIIGKIGIVDTDKAIFNQQINAIIPNENLIIGKYLAYVLHSMKRILQDKANAPIVPIINKSDFSKIKVRIPDLDYQKRVIEVLDESQELICKRQSQIAALDELINAYFYETLKSDLKSLSLEELIVNTQNGMSRRGNDENGQIVLKLKNVKNNEVNFDTINRIDLTEREAETYELHEQDLLVVRVNGNPKYVGRSAVFKGYDESVYFNDHIIRVKVANVNVNYLSYLLNSNLGISEIQKNIKTSAGQYTVSRDGLNKIKLKIPNEIIQNEFIRKKEVIDLKKAQLEGALERLEILYNALLQKAFKGELFQEQRVNKVCFAKELI